MKILPQNQKQNLSPSHGINFLPDSANCSIPGKTTNTTVTPDCNGYSQTVQRDSTGTEKRQPFTRLDHQQTTDTKLRDCQESRSAAPLGIYCQNPGVSESVPESGLARRYRLQDAAAKLLPDEKEWRVAACGRRIAPSRSPWSPDEPNIEGHSVDVNWRPSDGRVHYRNLVVCARVWQCPVCAARITEMRRAELTNALASAQLKGFFTAHIILTLRHEKADKLPDTLQALKRAKDALKNGEWFQNIKARYGWIGSIYALEVTYGENGWHPHEHELAVFDHALTEAELDSLTNALKTRWKRCAERAGYDASWERGLVVKSAHSDLAEYVAKFGHEPENPQWSPEHEISKLSSKVARTEKGRTPFQLLNDFDNGDEYAGKLFQEYAKAFKGKHQLRWSPLLRKCLNVGDEISDSELLENDESESEVTLIQLWADEWKRVLTLNLRAALLEVASAGKADVLESWLVQKGVRKSQADEMRSAAGSHHGDESESDQRAQTWMLRHDSEDWRRVEWINPATGEILDYAPIS